MERIDISEWTRRRAGALLGRTFQVAANFVPLPVVVSTGGGFTVKATLVGLVITLPQKPTFEQLDALPRRTGRIIDIFENALLASDDLNVAERRRAMELSALIENTPNGSVQVTPAFYGRDP